MRLDEIFGFGKKRPESPGIPYSEFVKRKYDRPIPKQGGGAVDPQTAQRNLKQWFGKSWVRDGANPRRVFHGTPTDLSTGVFKPSAKGVFGPGIYFTSNSTTASNYASGKRRSVHGTETVQGNVMPVYLKIERPFTPLTIMQNKQFVSDMMQVLDPPSFKRMIGMSNTHPEVKGVIRKLKSGDTKPIDICYIANTIPELFQPIYGVIRKHFDGIIVADQAEGHMEYVVWSPNQVKSALSNNGEYNPSKTHISEDTN